MLRRFCVLETVGTARRYNGILKAVAGKEFREAGRPGFRRWRRGVYCFGIVVTGVRADCPTGYSGICI